MTDPVDAVLRRQDAIARRERQAPDATYNVRCDSCVKTFADPGTGRRHAREQRHVVVITETVDCRPDDAIPNV